VPLPLISYDPPPLMLIDELLLMKLTVTGLDTITVLRGMPVCEVKLKPARFAISLAVRARL